MRAFALMFLILVCRAELSFRDYAQSPNWSITIPLQQNSGAVPHVTVSLTRPDQLQPSYHDKMLYFAVLMESENKDGYMDFLLGDTNVLGIAPYVSTEQRKAVFSINVEHLLIEQQAITYRRIYQRLPVVRFVIFYFERFGFDQVVISMSKPYLQHELRVHVPIQVPLNSPVVNKDQDPCPICLQKFDKKFTKPHRYLRCRRFIRDCVGIDYGADSPVYMSNCQHLAHADCLNRWMKSCYEDGRVPECAVCRGRVTQE